jgi:hypothetical protein
MARPQVADGQAAYIYGVCYEPIQRALDLNIFLDKRLKRWNMNTRLGTWNVRSLYRARSLVTVSKERSKYKIDLLGVQEVRWEGGGNETRRRIHILWKGESEP